MNGGDTVKTLLVSKFKETLGLSLENFTSHCVSQYIDFIYLATDAIFDNDMPNLLELYQLADYLQQDDLIIHLENKINLYSTLTDVDLIRGYCSL